MTIIIFACEIGQTNGGKGQYAHYMLRHLVPSLVAEGHHVTVLVPKDAALALPPRGPARVVRLPVPKNTGTWRAVWEEIYAPFLTWGADVLLSLSGLFPLTPICAKRKLVVVHDIHPLQHLANPAQYPGEYTRKSLIYASLSMKRATRMADRIITDSQSVAAELQKFAGVPSNRIVTIPCGVDHERFRPPQDQAPLDEVRRRYDLPDDFYLFVGQADTKKNFPLICETYRAAKDRPEIFLPVVVAGGEGRSTFEAGSRALLEQIGKPNFFRFLGFVPEDDLPALYGGARALIHPALHEGFGLPPLEAMACGTPVVASNRASLPEVVGDAALLIDPLRAETLIEALHRVNDEPVREEMIQKGLTRAQAFSWERSASQLAEQILGQHRWKAGPLLDGSSQGRDESYSTSRG